MCAKGMLVRLRGVVVVLRSARLAELGVQVPLEVGVDVSLVPALSHAVVLRWNACGREEECENLEITQLHAVSTAFVLDVLLKTVSPFIIATTGLAVPRLVVVVLVDDVLLLETLEQLLRGHDLGAVAGRVTASIHCDVRDFLDHELRR